MKLADRMLPRYLPGFEKAYAALATDDFLRIVDADLEMFNEQGGEEMDSDDESGDDDEDEDDSNINIEIDSDISVSSDEGEEDAHLTGSLTRNIMAFWKHRRVKLVHDYSRAGRLLSSSPSIVENVKVDATQEDYDACERLIFKLFLPVQVVGDARVKEKARLMKQFMSELKDFQNRTGVFQKDYIWLLAEVS